MPNNVVTLAPIRVREYLLDFVACLIPGFIFFVAASSMILGLICIYFALFLASFPGSLDTKIMKDFFLEITSRIDWRIWFSAGVMFISYLIGQLLYRLDPKGPDYPSFLKIRHRVLSDKCSWVIEKNKGLLPIQVQFPYDNLKNYLQDRGLKAVRMVDCDSKENICGKASRYCDKFERSKTAINKIKMEIFFHNPEKSFQIIRNEALIRLDSSVWYASRILLRLSSWCNLIIAIVIFNLLFDEKIPNNYVLITVTMFYIALRLIISMGINLIRNPPINWNFLDIVTDNIDDLRQILKKNWYKNWSKKCIDSIKLKISENKSGNNDEKDSTIFSTANSKKLGRVRRVICSINLVPFIWLLSNTKRIYMIFRLSDYSPLIMSLFLLGFLSWINVKSNILSEAIIIGVTIIYLFIVVVIILVSIFAKGYIEETYHYQRVREIVFVLETAIIANDEKKSKEHLQEDS